MIKKIVRFIMLIVLILVSTSFTLSLPNEAEAATGTSSGKFSKWYGGYETSTSYHTINGIVAWCINPELPWPYDQEYIETVFNDVGVYNIIYYAIENGYHLNADDYVDTYVALNWYLGKTTSQAKQNDPTVKYLYNKAKNPDAPMGTFDIQNKIQTASFTSGNSYQETEWYKPVTDGNNIKYTLTVPSGITLITSDGQTKGAGTHTLNQNQNFKLRASTEYEGTINLTANSNVLKSRALVFLPTNPAVQRLATIGGNEDPVSVPDIKATFFKRTGTGTVYKKDKQTGKTLSGAEFSVKNLSTGSTKTITTNSNGTISWGEALIGNTLEVTEKNAPKNYILNSEKQTIKIKSGNNNNLTFQNDRKAELQLSKVQIYTDRAADGLPIKIHTKRVQTSPTASQKEVTVSVYEKSSGKKVLSMPYKIGQLPSVINATIPSTYLNKDQKQNYIVKLEVDDKFAYITDGYGQIDTDGYTSSQKQITVQATNSSKIDYKGVVMTERSIKNDMKVFYETFSIPTNKLKEQKTGYGFNRDFQTIYTNDLNQRTNINLIFTTDSELIDSHINVSTHNPTSDILLEQTKREDFSGKDQRLFQLPHVNVEKNTGNLFYDSQVSAGDSRIRYVLRDGGRKFYVPVWSDLGNYTTSVKNANPVGINQLNIKIEDSLNLYAQMIATYDSETKSEDEIMISPVDSADPFSNGIPDNFGYLKNGTRTLTDEEKNFFKIPVSEQKVSITYTGDGSGNPANATVNVGHEFVISNQIPTLNGYFFKGWKSTIDGRIYQPGDSIKPNQNASLTSQWTQKKVAILYDSNGGVNAPANENLQLGVLYTISSDYPSKEGYEFTGWKSSLDSKSYVSGSNMTLLNDVTFTAQWKIAQQTVSYDANGGKNAPGSVEVNNETNYTISPQKPVRDDYTFDGWEYEGKTYQAGDQVTVQNSNVEFVAIWTRNQVTINYEENGGENAPAEDKSEVAEKYTISSQSPTMLFAEFTGWKSSADNKIYQPGELIDIGTTDIDLTAQWKYEQKTVSYNINEGTNGPKSEKVNITAEYTVSNQKPSNTGFDFVGWEYEGKIYQSGDQFIMPEKDVTLTAQWEIGRHQITYDANGGSGKPENIMIGSNMDFEIENMKPTKVGYTFKGWKSSSDGKLYQPGDLVSVTKDTTYSAQWTINKYSVSYSLNGGTGNFNSVTQNYNTLFTVSSTKPTRAGYSFSGWKRSDTETIVQPGAAFTLPENDVTLTAQWTINNYTVSYNLNSGSGNFSAITQNYGTSFKVSSTKPTRTGYSFSGWKRSDTGTIVQPGAAFTLPENDVTLTAQWTIIKYEASYDLNGGSGSFSSVDQNYNTSFTVPSIEPARTGYTFNGWKRSDTGAIVQSGDKFNMPANNVTLTAQWLEDSSYLFKLITHNPEITSSSYGFGTLYGLNLKGGKQYYTDIWGNIDQQAKDDGKDLQVSIYAPDWSWSISLHFTALKHEDRWKGTYFRPVKDSEYRVEGYLYPNGGSRSGKATFSIATIYQNDDSPDNTGSGSGVWKKGYMYRTITIPEPTASRTGYTFIGWEVDRTGQIVQPGSKYTLAHDKITFTAQWKKN